MYKGSSFRFSSLCFSLCSRIFSTRSSIFLDGFLITVVTVVIVPILYIVFNNSAYRIHSIFTCKDNVLFLKHQIYSDFFTISQRDDTNYIGIHKVETEVIYKETILLSIATSTIFRCTEIELKLIFSSFLSTVSICIGIYIHVHTCRKVDNSQRIARILDQ